MENENKSNFYSIPEEDRIGLKIRYKLPKSKKIVTSEILNFGWKGYPFCQEMILVKDEKSLGIYIGADSIISILTNNQNTVEKWT